MLKMVNYLMMIAAFLHNIKRYFLKDKHNRTGKCTEFRVCLHCHYSYCNMWIMDVKYGIFTGKEADLPRAEPGFSDVWRHGNDRIYT